MRRYLANSLTATIAFATLSVVIGNAAPAWAEDLEDVQQLMNTRQCQGCDLSRSGFVHSNLSGVDLSGADLSQANLNGADLRNANLSGANLTSAVLMGADLSGADLTGANLAGADLREAYLTGAIVDETNIDGAVLLGAVGLPDGLLSAEDYYFWGLSEVQRGNYEGAVSYYDQALNLDPAMSDAVLARAVARYRLSDLSGALADAAQAEQMFVADGNLPGQEASQRLTMLINAYIEAGDVEISAGKPNFLNFLTSVSSFVLQYLFRGGLF